MSTESNRNRRERTFRYQWPAEVLELARSAQDLGREEQNEIVAKLAAITGYPRRACRRLVKHVTSLSRKPCYVWPAEIEALLHGKRKPGGAERTALLEEIIARTGYPRRICRDFLRRRLGYAKPPIPTWPPEARDFVEVHRGVNREQVWGLVLEVMKMTGRPKSSCWKFVHRILECEKKALRRWPEEVRALVRGNERTEGPEFEALVAAVKERTGYEESVCRRFVLRAAEGKQYSHYQWPKEARELVRKSRGTGPAGYGASVEKLVAMTGHPRMACRRWLRSLGVKSGRRVRPWKAVERQKLAKALGNVRIGEIAQQLRRSKYAVRRMISKLGWSVDRHKTWYTVSTLARTLHVAPQSVQRWIDLGLLPQTALGSGEFQRWIITGDDVERFCQEHPDEILGGKVDPEQVNIVRQIANPARNEPVREMKKQKTEEKQEQKKKKKQDERDSEDDPDLAA